MSWPDRKRKNTQAKNPRSMSEHAECTNHWDLGT
jgi:hypothetical protein